MTLPTYNDLVECVTGGKLHPDGQIKHDPLVLKNEERLVWGDTPNGFIEDHPNVPSMMVVTLPKVGRVFVRGREVNHYRYVTLLGEEYFMPAGRCGGRILS